VLNDAPVRVTAGDLHTCQIKEDGTVRCWGSNHNGQLGDGTNITRTTPIPVVGLTNAVAIAAGSYHTCALLVDGSARCWGYNANGQLGDGSITTRFSPVFVGGLFANTVAITAGAYHSCALLVDGSGRCWGRGDKGQLGDGTTTAIQSLPDTVSGLANAVALSAGGDVSGDFGHSCALVANGGARCWGANESGQLGDGTTTSRLTPTVVSFQQNSLVTTLGLTTQIVTGSNHSCALQASGAVHCWGSNQVGQLGNGTKINKLRPGTLLSVSSTVLSVTLNIDPTVTLDHNTREAAVTIFALCEEGHDLHVDVTLTQGAVSGHGVGGGECTGGLGRYPVTVTAQAGDEFELGAAEVHAVGVISEDGVVVDNQEWTRAVQIVGPAPTLEGSATAVGTNKDSASVRLTGQFTAGSAIALDHATLTVSALLDEADGAGELVRGNGGATLLPLTLGARAGSTPTAAIYQRASGVRPVVWAEVKNRDPKTARIEFSIKVDRATMPIGPALCSAGSPSTTELTTQFNLQVGTGTPVGVEVIVPWQCLGTQMRTP
jgi:hypothetical protein